METTDNNVPSKAQLPHCAQWKTDTCNTTQIRRKRGGQLCVRLLKDNRRGYRSITHASTLFGETPPFSTLDRGSADRPPVIVVKSQTAGLTVTSADIANCQTRFNSHLTPSCSAGKSKSNLMNILSFRSWRLTTGGRSTEALFNIFQKSSCHRTELSSLWRGHLHGKVLV